MNNLKSILALLVISASAMACEDKTPTQQVINNTDQGAIDQAETIVAEDRSAPRAFQPSISLSSEVQTDEMPTDENQDNNAQSAINK